MSSSKPKKKFPRVPLPRQTGGPHKLRKGRVKHKKQAALEAFDGMLQELAAAFEKRDNEED